MQRIIIWGAAIASIWIAAGTNKAINTNLGTLELGRTQLESHELYMEWLTVDRRQQILEERAEDREAEEREAIRQWRIHLTRDFLTTNKGERLPYWQWAEDLVDEAEKAGIDWKLMPAIVWAESTGGKRCDGVNCFGWSANAYASLGKPPADIKYLAGKLAGHPYYAGSRGYLDVLCTYNEGHVWPCEYAAIGLYQELAAAE